MMKPERLTAIFFLGAILISLCLVFAGVLIRASEKLTEASKNVYTDWEKLYPFENSTAHLPENNVTTPKQSLFRFANYLKEKIGAYTSEKIAGSFKFVKAAKTYEDLIGWNITVQGYNPVIKLNDGYLSTITVNMDVSENIQAVKELNDFCRERNIDYAYINIPAKVCASDDTGISGILDYANQNADKLLDAIGRAGVKCYDFRKILHEDGMNHHKAFFITDHHWKPETGLWAAKHILEFLRDDFGWKVDPEILNPDRFEYKVYPEWFLGSQGKKVTLARTKPDDFTIIYPKFRTLIRFEVPTRELDISGDLSITYDMEHVELKDYYKLNPYAAYKYADQPLTRIHNLLNHNGKKILIIHDSLSNCVIQFVSLGIEYTDELDLRHFTGSLRSYIKSTKPDIVFTAYNASIPGHTDAYYKKFYDFR